MPPTQDLLLFPDGDRYAVLTEYTREPVGHFANAREALQHAIDLLAGAGGSVRLGRGDYPLDGAVRLGSNVWLQGSGRSTRLRVSLGAGVGLLGEGIDGAVVSDLAVLAEDGAEAGVVLDSSGDCKLRDLFCAGFQGYGIWVRNNTFLSEVRGCSLAGNKTANLYLEYLDRGRSGYFIPNLVTNCMIYGGGKGIDCDHTIVLNIVACVVFQSNGPAYHVRNKANSVVISGCRSFQITGEAVLVENSHEFNLSGNIFCWHTGHGVVVRDSYWGTLNGNEIIDTGSVNPGSPNLQTMYTELAEEPPRFDGIRLENSKGFQITGNTIFNWSVCPPLAYGIREQADCFKNNILGNNANYYEDGIVLCQGEGSSAGNNVGHADLPYNDMALTLTKKRVQSFQTELTAQFIAEQIA